MPFLKVLHSGTWEQGRVEVGWSYSSDAGMSPEVLLRNQLHHFPCECPLARGARAGIRLPLPIGLPLAPTDKACFSLAPPTALPVHTHTHTHTHTQ